MRCNRIVTIALLILMSAGLAQCKEKRKLRISGSNTMLPILKLVEKKYEANNPEIDLIISGQGSESGLDALSAGTADIATTSRDVYPGELDQLKVNGAVEVQEVAFDCLLLVVHPDNPMEALRLKETSDLFAGKIKNWKEVGGPDLPVQVFIRDEKSGSADYFQDHVLRQKDLGEDAYEAAKGRTYAEEATVVKSNAALSEKLSSTPGGVGFMGMGSAEKVHTALVKTMNYARVPGEKPVAPTIENVYNRTYRLSRPLYIVFRPGSNADVDAFSEWMISDEGQRIIKVAGYLRNTMEEVQVIEQRNNPEDEENKKEDSKDQ